MGWVLVKAGAEPDENGGWGAGVLLAIGPSGFKRCWVTGCNGRNSCCSCPPVKSEPGALKSTSTPWTRLPALHLIPSLRTWRPNLKAEPIVLQPQRRSEFSPPHFKPSCRLPATKRLDRCCFDWVGSCVRQLAPQMKNDLFTSSENVRQAGRAQIPSIVQFVFSFKS